MKCPKCNFENPDDTLYCGKCGTKFEPPEEISVSPTETLETAKEELTTGSTFAGRYQIIEELGKGGMGKVYKALDKEIKGKVALKLIKPEVAAEKRTIERFRNELKMARDIAHKNVCRMYDLNKEEGTYYITMEYVSGEDLKSFIRRAGPLSPGKTIFIAKQVCDGLVEAHRLGVVHRDLKPQNVMIDREGNARIMDFGIARSLKEKGITGAGVMIGTPEYMSPEQVEAKEVDQRSDIYSLGVILYEMVTGRVPFEGETPLSIAVKHKTETPLNPKEINSQVPEALSRVILKCIEKDKQNRYQSAEEVRSELTKLEKGIPTIERILPKVKTETEKIRKMRWKNYLLYGGITGLVILALILSYFLLLQKPPLVDRKSIAVLPFENLSDDKEAEFFSDGVTEDIITQISKIGDLLVISRDSAMRYKNTDKSIREIGKELKVATILDGSVRRAGDRVRIVAQLIDAETDKNLWGETYTLEMTDIFTVQSDVAEKISRVLKAKFSPEERLRIEKKPTDNMDAYYFYRRGREYTSGSTTDEKYSQAIQMFQKAIEIDPKFSLAYVGLSRAHSTKYFYGFDKTDKRRAKAKEAVDRALELEPDLPEAHRAFGLYHYFCHLDYESALEEYDIALKGMPNNPHLYASIAYIQRRQGKFNEALENLENAFSRDPQSDYLPYQIGVTYWLMRQYLEAEEYLNRAFFKVPDDTDYSSTLAQFYISRGETEKAREVLEKSPKPHDPRLGSAWFQLNLVERNYQEALELLSSAAVESFDFQHFSYPKALLFAIIYELTGKKQQAQAYFDSARIFLEKKLEKGPNDERLHSALGIALAGLGQKEEAIQAGMKGIELQPVSKEAMWGPWRIQELARIYVMLGEYDAAIDQIEYILSIPSIIPISTFRVFPVWDPLRNNPRFQKLLAQEK